MQSKNELRAELRAKRKAIDKKAQKSADIARKILEMPEVKSADTLLVFYPLEDEVDLLPIARYAWSCGKLVGFPLCEDKNGVMTFRLVSSLADLSQKSFGIMEPSESAPIAVPQNAVIFLPALAIDKNGYRIGYGKGYYDRYLAAHANRSLYKVGVIYKALLCNGLPHDEYDVPCDTVVCED